VSYLLLGPGRTVNFEGRLSQSLSSSVTQKGLASGTVNLSRSIMPSRMPCQSCEHHAHHFHCPPLEVRVASLPHLDVEAI
jgi:hypothetical protein